MEANQHWLCATCATEFPPAPAAPQRCPICEDERQYLPPQGQRWTTVDQVREEGRSLALEEVEPGLHRLTVTPSVGIGQQPMIVATAEGNLMFDVPGFIDDAAVAAVAGLGGLAAIAPSHPHHLGVQTLWSQAFGDAPIWVNGKDREWVQRLDGPLVFWDGPSAEPLPEVGLHTIGGHFPGSTVAHWSAGADGRGVLLTGDGIAPVAAAGWVSFLRSYPNQLPLSAAVVRRIAATVESLPFDRIYDEFARSVPHDARAAVRRSVERHAAWVSGEHDDLT